MTKLSALLAIAAVAPAVVAPNLVASAHAQGETSAEFPDVPKDHWAYAALQKLAAAGVLEGYPPSGNYIGAKPMTRYEFAVAIARVLNQIPAPAAAYVPPTDLVHQPELDATNQRVTALEARPIPDITRAQVDDLLKALRTEFAAELATIDGRLDVDEARITALENKVPAPPRMTVSLAVLSRAGDANYIDNIHSFNAIAPGGTPGNAALPNTGAGGVVPIPTHTGATSVSDEAFSYTDVEIRLTDHVTDRLSVNAALRSLDEGEADNWTGQPAGVNVREANAAADLSNYHVLGFKNTTATLGIQHTKIGLGLLYDNELAPTDQARIDSNWGPLKFTAFVGASGNSTGIGGTSQNPYLTGGAVGFLDPVNSQFGVNRSIGFGRPNDSQSALPGQTGFAQENPESLGRVAATLFHISGQPVDFGLSSLLQGEGAQSGNSADLSLPLFGRTIGLEGVVENRYADGSHPVGSDPGAFLADIPVLRSSVIDLNLSYGISSNDFEYYGISSANPYARTYGEAIFDRPVALGAPLIDSSEAGTGTGPAYTAAREVAQVGGTVRLPIGFLRKLPFDYGFYHAEGGETSQGGSRVNLGNVYTLGTSYPVTSGLSLEVKGGYYQPAFFAADPQTPIRYLRVGANVGF